MGDQAIVGMQTTTHMHVYRQWSCGIAAANGKGKNKKKNNTKKNLVTYSILNGRNPFSSVGIPYVLEHLMSPGRTVLLQRNVLDGPTWKTHFGLPVACHRRTGSRFQKTGEEDRR